MRLGDSQLLHLTCVFHHEGIQLNVPGSNNQSSSQFHASLSYQFLLVAYDSAMLCTFVQRIDGKALVSSVRQSGAGSQLIIYMYMMTSYMA